MKTKVLLVYFLILFTVLALGLSAGFYFFNFEKKYALQSALLLQQKKALELIVDQVYGDLLIDNTMEVERKLNVLAGNKTIESFTLVKQGENRSTNSDSLCQIIYFDKANKTGEWGKLCLKFTSEHLGAGALNLRGVTIVVICLSVFLVLIIIGIFNKISRLNVNLHEGVRRTLEAGESSFLEAELWEPVLGQLKEESRKKNIAEEQLKKKQIEEEKVLLAQQVSHDIRSPLSVLQLSSDDIEFKDSERKQLFHNAIARINEIANDLLSKKNEAEVSNIVSDKINTMEIIDIAPLVESIIAEKKMVLSGNNCQIIFNSVEPGLKAYLRPADFKRVISNLLNNAIESLDNVEGKIIIELNGLIHKIQLSIVDNGKGIPPEILSRLGTKGFSHGKENSTTSGSGLGLYHARQTIESFGGTLSIFSKPNEGTMISIELNR